MSRTRAEVALSLFALVVLFPTAKVVARPPDERSSAMKLDKVEDGLRHYYQQKTDDRRVEWLKRLAPSKDPRVKAALEAARCHGSKVVAEAAGELLAQHYGRVRYFLIEPPPALPLVRPPAPPPRPAGPPES